MPIVHSSALQGPKVFAWWPVAEVTFELDEPARARGAAAPGVGERLRESTGAGASPGRTDLYQLDDRYVLVDHGHNPASLRLACALASRWQGRLTGVVSVPGDRSNALLEACAHAIAQGLHRVILKEDDDRRGRQHGETAERLHQALLQEDATLECEEILDEEEAIMHALDTTEPGEVVVIFTDNALRVEHLLAQYGGEPCDGVDERMNES